MAKLFSILPLKFRITIIIMFWAGLVLVAVTTYNYFSAKKSILLESNARYATLAELISGRIDIGMTVTEKNVEEMALQIFSNPHPLSRADLKKVFTQGIYSQLYSLGGLVIFTPESKIEREYDNLYVRKIKDSEHRVELIERPVEVDYTEDWYTIPYNMQTPVWSEPYYDPIVNEVMITYSFPFITEKNGVKKIEAIVTTDLAMAWIQKMIYDKMQANGTMICLFTDQMIFITHKNVEYTLRESYFSLAEQVENPEQRHFYLEEGYKLKGNSSGVLKNGLPNDKTEELCYFDTVKHTNWKVGIIVDKAIIEAEADKMLKYTFILSSIGLFVLLFSSFKLASSFASPIMTLSDIANTVAGGNFDVSVPKINAGREVDNLADSFRKMIKDLRKHIAYLAIANAQKEKISGELSIARDIQMGLVPKILPPFPYDPRVDLYAKLVPALEVGGDFYDFAFIDSEHLYISVGDVSGKGIAAALMMAVTKTLLHSAIMNYQDPARALYDTNNEIVQANDAYMFITVFIAVINVRTGKMVWSSAGHNPPLLHRAETNESLWLKTHPKPPIGPFPNIIYSNELETLQPYDTLMIYTDGITEAMTQHKEMFGEARLEAYVKEHHKVDSPELLDSLYAHIDQFIRGANQYDDMTSISLKILPTQRNIMPLEIPPVVESLELSKQLTDLNRLVEWLENCCEKHGIEMPVMMKLNLVLEEWFVNIVSYAFPDGESHTINFEIALDGDKVFIRIEDDGIAFDPTSNEANEYFKPMEERRIGGLGIHFIRETMETFHYARIARKNIITLMTRRSSTF